MQKNKAVLAGELSGHMFFADQYFGYDDGIYAMLRFLSLLMASKELLEELLAVMPRTYSTRELRVPYDQNKKEEIFKKFTDYFSSNPAAHLVHIDGVRVVVPYGWAIVRASNTQPVLSIRAESETKDGLLHIASDVQAILNEYINPELLSHELAQ
jgi:phosphomannomutase